MDTLRVSQVVAPSDSSVPLGRSRYGAAVLALAFPVAVATIFAGGLFLRGFASLLTHTGLVVTLPAGVVALVIWCRRYWSPALTALKNSVPISLERGLLRVNGEVFRVTDDLTVRSTPSVLAVMEGNQEVATFPGYFIRLLERA